MPGERKVANFWDRLIKKLVIFFIGYNEARQRFEAITASTQEAFKSTRHMFCAKESKREGTRLLK